jgi:hypothetical protein
MSRPLIHGLILAALFVRPSLAQCAIWDSAFPQPGMQGVWAIQEFDDGSGAALYAGGEFLTAGAANVKHIARWTGASWSPVGEGMDGYVQALQVFDDGSGPALYAGGVFTIAGRVNASHVAKWNGTSWSALGSGVDGEVFALRVFDDGSGPALYVGGSFTTAGGVSANYIAKWNGTSWSALGSGVDGYVVALQVFDDGSGPALYAGGGFTSAGGSSANLIAKWDGSSWSALGSGLQGGVVWSLAVFDDGYGSALYAGGEIYGAGQWVVGDIAKWNGTSWSQVDAGVDNEVHALLVFDDGSGPALYAGGSFKIADTYIPAPGIARWNGASWSAVGSGMNREVYTLHAFDEGSGSALFAGGIFNDAGDVGTGGIAKWNGASWSALSPGDGTDSDVLALEVFDDGTGPALYAGGQFQTAGEALADSIAKWNGTSWSPLGSGMRLAGDIANVWTLAVFDDGAGPALYAGGDFTTAGGTPAAGIAKWNGVSWSALSSGMNGVVYALKVFDDGSGPVLYAGGGFSTAGGTTARCIAKWNGTTWSALGIGLGGSSSNVRALEVFDDGFGPALYAGGGFFIAGGASANYIAKWNGAAWSTVGGGTNLDVLALHVFDDGSGDALYAGGAFTVAGGTSASLIAKWNGTSWSALGAGLNGIRPSVLSLRAFDDGSGSALYAGGFFTVAGGTSANYIAQWNGTRWSEVGGGTDGVVFALRDFDDGHDADADLFLGGGFSRAGDLPSSFISQWHGCGTSSFCSGDGSIGACPCANNGLPGHGCDNSSSTGGARLSVSGVASLAYDTVSFHASGEKPTALSIVSQGQSQIAPVAFGQGLRCVAGNLKRLYVEHSVGGEFSAPTGAEPSVHARSAALGDAIPAGSSRYYYANYRDQNVLGGCSPANTFNATQSLRVIWAH